MYGRSSFAPYDGRYALDTATQTSIFPPGGRTVSDIPTVYHPSNITNQIMETHVTFFTFAKITVHFCNFSSDE